MVNRFLTKDQINAGVIVIINLIRFSIKIKFRLNMKETVVMLTMANYQKRKMS